MMLFEAAKFHIMMLTYLLQKIILGFSFVKQKTNFIVPRCLYLWICAKLRFSLGLQF